MIRDPSAFAHVTYSWDAGYAATLDPVARLVYRSNLLGADQRITNTGGGNTSAKLSQADPLSGDPVEVLWVKGSGGDLRTAGREHFASLYLERLHGLKAHYERAPRAAPRARSRTRWSACTPTAPSTSTRAPPRSTPRCTPSCPPVTSTTCTPTP